MGCGCQKVCIRGDLTIDTTSPLNVNVVNTAPIAVTGDQGAPIAVFGVEGAPVVVTIDDTNPIEIVAHRPFFLTGGADWDLPAEARSVTIIIIAAAAANAVTITDDDGSTDIETAGIVLSYSGNSDNSVISGGALNILATGTGKALVTWTS